MLGPLSLPPRVSDSDMHHDTCMKHVPWCMPGSLTSGFLWSRWRGKTFPAFPAHAQPTILRFCQEAHRINIKECDVIKHARWGWVITSHRNHGCNDMYMTQYQFMLVKESHVNFRPSPYTPTWRRSPYTLPRSSRDWPYLTRWTALFILSMSQSVSSHGPKSARIVSDSFCCLPRLSLRSIFQWQQKGRTSCIQ